MNAVKCSCGSVATSSALFCAMCGEALLAPGRNSVATGGGDIRGGVFQAGRDVVVNPREPEPPTASYEAVPVWRSPLTLGLLSWLGLILGVLGVVPIWQILRPAVGLIAGGGDQQPPAFGSFVWSWFLLIIVALLGIVIGLRRTAKTETRWPLFLGWAVSGAGRRISLEKISAGRCPLCQGDLKYFRKATAWVDHIDVGGRRRREVTQRVPALECKRNPSHWFEIDPAE